MRSRISLIFMVANFFSFEIEGQNLVPNFQFEHFTTCPAGAGGAGGLDSGWVEFGSADYFHSCDMTGDFGTPLNTYFYQAPVSGEGYMGLYAYYQTVFSREYIEVSLLDTLIAGQTYYVRFYVSLADTFQYAVENLGALFTDTLFDPYPPPSWIWQTGIPQIENLPGNMLNDKSNWTPIQGSFVAVGGERYVTIGNFKDDTQTVEQNLASGGSNNFGAYYLIEDVYVGITPPPVGVQENMVAMQDISFYPNPTNSSITVAFETNSEKASFSIMNYSGQIVMKNEDLKTIKGKNEMVFDLSNFSNGIYLIQVQTENIFLSKKIIKN